jgi:hypothetical protein
MRRPQGPQAQVLVAASKARGMIGPVLVPRGTAMHDLPPTPAGIAPNDCTL